MNKEERQLILQTLRDSCEEGADGTWDCSPEGFEAMIEDIDRLAALLRVKLKDKEYHYARKCDHCGKGMNEGYVVNKGDEYYCSDTCVSKHYTSKEWSKMYENDQGYWTGWVEDHDMEHIGDRHGNIIRDL